MPAGRQLVVTRYCQPGGPPYRRPIADSLNPWSTIRIVRNRRSSLSPWSRKVTTVGCWRQGRSRAWRAGGTISPPPLGRLKQVQGRESTAPRYGLQPGPRLMRLRSNKARHARHTDRRCGRRAGADRAWPATARMRPDANGARRLAPLRVPRRALLVRRSLEWPAVRRSINRRSVVAAPRVAARRRPAVSCQQHR